MHNRPPSTTGEGPCLTRSSTLILLTVWFASNDMVIKAKIVLEDKSRYQSRQLGWGLGDNEATIIILYRVNVTLFHLGRSCNEIGSKEPGGVDRYAGPGNQSQCRPPFDTKVGVLQLGVREARVS